jgi:hypothetical protein
VKGNKVSIRNIARALGGDTESFHILETIRLANPQKRNEWKTLIGYRDAEFNAYENMVSILREAAKNGPREVTYKELWNIALARDRKNPRPKSYSAIIGYLSNHPKLPESLGLSIKPHTVRQNTSEDREKPTPTIASSRLPAKFTLPVRPSRQLAALAVIIERLSKRSEGVSKPNVSIKHKQNEPGLTIQQIADAIWLEPRAIVSADFIRSLLTRMRHDDATRFRSIASYIIDL